jgi:nicotinamide riboside transporter PnuC
MKRFLSNPTVRGLALVAVFALVVVLLSLEQALLTASALLSVAFFLAVAFFLFLVWRERRSDIDTWSDRGRRTFYGAIVLAVLDVAALFALRPSGADALAFFAVLAACAYALVRVWRDQHRYS